MIYGRRLLTEVLDKEKGPNPVLVGIFVSCALMRSSHQLYIQVISNIIHFQTHPTVSGGLFYLSNCGIAMQLELALNPRS